MKLEREGHRCASSGHLDQICLRLVKKGRGFWNWVCGFHVRDPLQGDSTTKPLSRDGEPSTQKDQTRTPYTSSHPEPHLKQFTLRVDVA